MSTGTSCKNGSNCRNDTLHQFRDGDKHVGCASRPGLHWTEKIAKFEGGWHGGYDALHKAVKPPFEQPDSAGLTPGALEDTLTLPFNDLEGVRKRIKGIEKEVAAIIIEPVLGAGGAIPAEKEFLKGLRELCDQHGILLIVNEVITGFRLAPEGVQQFFGVKPDITVLGKILGGVFQVGAFCGSAEIMGRIDTHVTRGRTIHSMVEHSLQAR